jgi:hypothetical protein
MPCSFLSFSTPNCNAGYRIESDSKPTPSETLDPLEALQTSGNATRDFYFIQRLD